MKKTFAICLLLCTVAGAALGAPAPDIPITQTDENTLVFSFAGDCTLGSENDYQKVRAHFTTVVSELGFEHPFSGVKKIFEADDLTLVNLEGTFTDYTRSVNKKYTFRAPPEFAEILPLGSVEAVNLANNHTYDFSLKGYRETLEALDVYDIAYCDNDKPVMVEIKGVKIGLFGVCAPRNYKLTTLIEQMEEMREEGATVFIASMHWGVEYGAKQNAEQREYAHRLIEAGIDVVVGTHPHVLQGVEWYEGRPIFYSLGNFSFGGNRNPRDWDTMIAQVTFDISGEAPVLTGVRIIPCLISDVVDDFQDFRPVPVVGEEASRILQKVGALSEGFPDTFFEDGFFTP